MPLADKIENLFFENLFFENLFFENLFFENLFFENLFFEKEKNILRILFFKSKIQNSKSKII